MHNYCIYNLKAVRVNKLNQKKIMRKSRLSRQKQNRLIEHFVAGTTVRTAAALIGINKVTSAFYFHRLRELIYTTAEIKQNNTNELEKFRRQAKKHFRKFNGIPKDHFHLYWKEYEWRFHNPDPAIQLKMLKQLVKKNLL